MESRTFYYARVSSREQNLDRQLAAFSAMGAQERDIITDKESGKDLDRRGYTALKAALLRPGDTLVVKSLDRLSRNKADIKNELQYFKDNRIRLKVLDLPTTMMDFPAGQKWIFDMVNNILIEVLGSIAEQERVTIHQRQAEGIAAAKAKGKHLGRTMSFSFFGSWFETLERLRESQGVEVAYNLFVAIANYSRYYDAPNFEDGSISQIFWPMIQREIDLSLKRRGANFSSDEAEERRQQVIAAYSENPSLSIRDIAEMTGVSKSAVGRILQKLKDNATEIEAVKEREWERELEGEIDTMGLGQDGTVGQQMEIEEPYSLALDKTLDYLWEKYSYRKDTITFAEDGNGIVEIDPALFYIPPEAWEFKGKCPRAKRPGDIQSRGNDTEDGDGELPF